MYQSANDVRAFYNTRIGRVVRRILKQQIHNFWPDAPEETIVGLGYATPYLGHYRDSATRVIALTPAEQGAYHWPHDAQNKTCLLYDDAIPLPDESVDKLLIVHNLEFSYQPDAMLQEIWRVLKPRGKALFLVPNRNGFWAQAEWSAFGSGRPYTLSQLCNTLHQNRFVTERIEESLYMPPIRRAFIMKSARFFEGLGHSILPIAAGVHMVEVSKQLYAPIDRGKGTLAKIRDQVRAVKPAVNNGKLSKRYKNL